MSDVTTVTSENLKDFQMGKLGFPAAEVPESEVVEVDEPESEMVAEINLPSGEMAGSDKSLPNGRVNIVWYFV